MFMTSVLRTTFASLLLMPAWLPLPAAAMPNTLTCRVTTYYQEAELETVVGTRTTCPGGQSSGRTSRYKEIEVVQLDYPGGGGGGSGGAGMPCEFVADGTGPWSPQNTCQNLPIPRGKSF